MCNPQGCEDQVTLKHRSAQRNQTAVHKTQSSGPFPTSLPSSELVSQKCPCQTRNMTTEHLLLACPQSLNHHLFIKFRIGQSELCLCQTGNMTTEHLQQAERPLYSNPRCQFWPVETLVARMLSGSLQDLQCSQLTDRHKEDTISISLTVQKGINTI